MKTKSLEKYFQRMSYRSDSQISTRFQSMRSQGLLPRERGMHAQDISHGQATHALFGMAADKAVDAGSVAISLSAYLPAKGQANSFAHSENLFDAVQRILGKEELAKAVDRLEIDLSFQRARLTWRERRKRNTAHFVDPKHDRFAEVAEQLNTKPETFDRRISYRLVFPGNILLELAQLLAVEEFQRGGWGSPTGG